MLASNSGISTLAVSSIGNNTLVLKSCLLLSKGTLCVVMVTVVEFSVLNSAKLCSMLLGENLAVLHWLDSAVVVILVNFLVDGSVDLFMYVRLDNLLLYGWGDGLVHSGVMVTRLAHEVADCCLGLIHCDCSWWCCGDMCWVSKSDVMMKSSVEDV